MLFRSVQKLKDFPEHEAELKLIEGLLYLGKSKPLLREVLQLLYTVFDRIEVTIFECGHAFLNVNPGIFRNRLPDQRRDDGGTENDQDQPQPPGNSTGNS